MMSGLKNWLLVNYWKVETTAAFADKDAQIHPAKKTSAETFMDQWVGSIQVYSYSPDSFYQKRVSGHFFRFDHRFSTSVINDA